MKLKFKLMLLTIMLCAGSAMADMTVQLYVVNENGFGSSIGQVSISESKYGMVFTPSLKGLTPGMHGFHLHQMPSCESKVKDGKMVPALAAGGHYYPLDTVICPLYFLTQKARLANRCLLLVLRRKILQVVL